MTELEDLEAWVADETRTTGELLGVVGYVALHRYLAARIEGWED